MNKNKISLVIFDLDGTLIDSTSEIGFVVNSALKKNGFPEKSKEFYKKNIGSGIADLLQKSLPDANGNIKDVKKILSEVKNLYSIHLNKKSKVFDGIYEILDFLKKENIQIAIVTNKLHQLAIRCVENYFNDYNIITIGAEDKFDRKPSPNATYEIINLYKVKPEASIFIGDSHIDIKTAKNANIKSGGVLWGNGTKEELKKADVLFTKTKELLNYLSEG
jgi:phosphoglycolate phosphatase